MIQPHFKKMLFLLPLGLLCILTACSSLAPVTKLKTVPTVQVNPSFQKQLSPIPTETSYVCGSWSSNNAPNAYSSIVIYARLMHDVHPISGATASATVHFHTFDLPLDQHPVSDNGGYVEFSLSLQGREPNLIPATVSVSFSLNKQTINCASAFFTPE